MQKKASYHFRKPTTTAVNSATKIFSLIKLPNRSVCVSLHESFFERVENNYETEKATFEVSLVKCSHWMALFKFIWRSKFITSSSNSKVQYNHLVKHPRKVMLSIFHLNASAALKLRFLPQTQKLKRFCAGIINSTTHTWRGFQIKI